MATEFTISTLAMHFYDSVVVFERGAYTKKFGAEIGGSFDKLAARVNRKLGMDHSQFHRSSSTSTNGS